MGFQVIGVVDLRGGFAVRARGGRRDMYAPVERVAGESIQPGDAVALARHYVERFGLSAIYVADLDAIEGREPQRAIVRAIASSGAVWLDSGIAAEEDAQEALKSGAFRVIVGLETLPSFEVLQSICQSAGPRVVFSLDLRDGIPIATTRGLAHNSPEELVTRGVAAGADAVIVLDLARVGSGSGMDIETLARIRSAAPSVPVYAGGGVRSIEDIEQLQRIGCDGALVASALLDGQLSRRDLNLQVDLGLGPST